MKANQTRTNDIGPALKKSMTFITFLVMMIGAVTVKAQTTVGAPKTATKEKKTVINFEDELVEGQADKPELFYLLQRKHFNNRKLIRFRENFIPEMKRSSEDIQRSGSQH